MSGDQTPNTGGTAGAVASQSQVRSALESSGYTNVQSIEQSGSGWTAIAEKDGQKVHVAVDSHGNIATQ